MKVDKLFFSSVKENRGKYFVEYSPPHHEWRFASLSLTYTEQVEPSQVAREMEEEGRHWLSRYPIPVMVSAFDESGSLIYLDDIQPESHFTCFYGEDGKKFEGHWKLLNDEDLPSQALNREYLLEVYADFKRRTSSQIKAEVEQRAKGTRLLVRLIFVWVVIIPALVAIAEFLAPQWVAVIILIYGLLKVLFKGLKMKGIIKKSKSELAKEEELRKMKHHHYHCERNPEGFIRLKLENFERMARADVKKEAEAIRSKPELDSPA